MEMDKERLQGEDARGVLRQFLKEVEKTEEEIENKETRGGREADLKIYVTSKNDYRFGGLVDHVYEHLEKKSLKKAARDFFSDHKLKEEGIEEGVSLVGISTPDYNRTDEFVFVDRDDYVWIFTLERAEWVEKTLDPLLKYLKNLERIYLSSDDLEEVMDAIGEDSDLSGFTSKYHSPYRDRKATLRFHGAEDGDIEVAKDAFDAQPTRIEFDQKNSPQAAIQGSNKNTGYASVESIREGSLDKAERTFWGLLSDNESHDEGNYKIEREIERVSFEDASATDGFTAVELVKQREGEEVESLREKLVEDVLSKKQFYRHGGWGDNTFFVLDKKSEEVLEVGLESPNIVVHALEGTTEAGLRRFCETVIEEFDSTYDLSKHQIKPGRQNA